MTIQNGTLRHGRPANAALCTLLGVVAGCTAVVTPAGSGGGGNGPGPVGSAGAGFVGTGSSGGTGAGPGPGGGGLSGTAGGGGPNPGGTGGSPGPLAPVVIDSARTVIRRLNRTEYNATVRDLLGTVSTPADKFPPDEVAEGFDTVGQFLAFSPLHAEQMETAATALIDELFALPSTDARRTKVLTCALQAGSEATCARAILVGFARRAYRRPATAAETTALMALVDKVRAGGTYTDGLKAALAAILISPHFLYKEETSVGVGAVAAASAKPLNAFELATRLSYFLWSTMPDDQLGASADAGTLIKDQAELPAQITRMLADSKASALTTNFASRWLTLYRLDTVAPEPTVYGNYDDALRTSAQKETAMFFQRLVADNLPLATLLTADFTYANARLGRQYGLTVTGDALTRVSLTGTPRAGLLTQTSFLMGNAHPDRSAPVFRGDWILDRILCSATPPPPNDLEIPPLAPQAGGTSGRQVLAAHRQKPECAACHNLIDPLGLGLENFDGIGGYRTTDNGVAVDASGVLPGGTPFNGAIQLAGLIAQDPRFAGCVTKQMLTYGVGRSFAAGPARTYASALAQHALADGKGSWRSWIAMVAASEAFRTNRAEPM